MKKRKLFSPVFISCKYVLPGICGVWWGRGDCVKLSCNLLSAVHWLCTHVRKTWQITIKCWIWVVNMWVFILLSVCLPAQLLSRVQLFVTPWTVDPRLLHPRDSPGKNTGVGFHALLQGILPTRGLDPHLLCLLHCRQVLYHWALWEAHFTFLLYYIYGNYHSKKLKNQGFPGDPVAKGPHSQCREPRFNPCWEN